MIRERLDIGSKFGRCTDGGVGIEISFDRAKKSKDLVIVADASLPVVKPKSFKHAIIFHVLEHLPNLYKVERVISEAADAAVDYLEIKGPWFDADEYLYNLGFNLYWSTWTCHPTHLTSRDLEEILTRLNYSFIIKGKGPLIKNSMDRKIHPKGYVASQYYNEKEHPMKEYIEFDIPIFSELTCRVNL